MKVIDIVKKKVTPKGNVEAKKQKAQSLSLHLLVHGVDILLFYK